MFLFQLSWWLCGPPRALPACSGQPLAHTLIGHTSDGGDLKEAAGQRESGQGPLSETEHSWGKTGLQSQP